AEPTGRRPVAAPPSLGLQGVRVLDRGDLAEVVVGESHRLSRRSLPLDDRLARPLVRLGGGHELILQRHRARLTRDLLLLYSTESVIRVQHHKLWAVTNLDEVAAVPILIGDGVGLRRGSIEVADGRGLRLTSARRVPREMTQGWLSP